MKNILLKFDTLLNVIENNDFLRVNKNIMDKVDAILRRIKGYFSYKIIEQSTYEKPFLSFHLERSFVEYCCTAFMFAVTNTTKHNGTCHFCGYIFFLDKNVWTVHFRK